MPEIQKPVPRGVYFGDRPSKWYQQLNTPNLDFSARQLPSLGEHLARRIIEPEGTIDRTWYQQEGNETGLDGAVKIVPLPVCIPPALSKSAIKEMQKLRAEGLLTSLRGGRPTDLARPLTPKVRARIADGSPDLVNLIRRVEEGIKGGPLFIRTLKFDEARASTTQGEADKSKPNLHFDAEGSSRNDYGGPVYQFYANVSRVPRQFNVLPIPLGEMIFLLKQNGLVTDQESQSLPLKGILARFTQRFNVPVEQIIVESGQLAIFNGRVYAHDAGKGQIRFLRNGEFRPSHEPDFVLALDTVTTRYYEGYYDPGQSILEDPGTDAWWAMMNKSNRS
ncbi:hypothetical protein HY214_02365 [Candidatus Roizmanbacteria bacterium]|nr:hypothetical protein [Candidatus Roizmanbacteria bacterium]